MILTRVIILFLLLFIFACNSNKSEEEMEELWSKAQTTGAIVDRSGTKFNTATNKDLAVRDAETRLQTGGGLLGKGGLNFGGILNNSSENNVFALLCLGLIHFYPSRCSLINANTSFIFLLFRIDVLGKISKQSCNNIAYISRSLFVIFNSK